jgi:hypothetical protein
MSLNQLPHSFSVLVILSKGPKTSISIEAEHFTPVDDNILPWKFTLGSSEVLILSHKDSQLL